MLVMSLPTMVLSAFFSSSLYEEFWSISFSLWNPINIDNLLAVAIWSTQCPFSPCTLMLYKWKSLLPLFPRKAEFLQVSMPLFWESDTTEWLHFHFSLLCTGEGNGNPLQCSCLENPRDRRAWWAAIYGVAQSRTRLKWLSNSSMPLLVQSCLHFLLKKFIKAFNSLKKLYLCIFGCAGVCCCVQYFSSCSKEGLL